MNYPAGYGECMRCGSPLRYCSDAVSDGWDAVIAVQAGNELTKVEMWRLHVLLASGYPVELAEQLAAANSSDVDLHLAVELVRDRGCKHETAAAILL